MTDPIRYIYIVFYMIGLAYSVKRDLSSTVYNRPVFAAVSVLMLINCLSGEKIDPADTIIIFFYKLFIIASGTVKSSSH